MEWAPGVEVGKGLQHVLEVLHCHLRAHVQDHIHSAGIHTRVRVSTDRHTLTRTPGPQQCTSTSLPIAAFTFILQVYIHVCTYPTPGHSCARRRACRLQHVLPAQSPPPTPTPRPCSPRTPRCLVSGCYHQSCTSHGPPLPSSLDRCRTTGRRRRLHRMNDAPCPHGCDCGRQRALPPHLRTRRPTAVRRGSRSQDSRLCRKHPPGRLIRRPRKRMTWQNKSA